VVIGAAQAPLGGGAIRAGLSPNCLYLQSGNPMASAGRAMAPDEPVPVEDIEPVELSVLVPAPAVAPLLVPALPPIVEPLVFPRT
jgi:hypothetical protein